MPLASRPSVRRSQRASPTSSAVRPWIRRGNRPPMCPFTNLKPKTLSKRLCRSPGERSWSFFALLKQTIWLGKSVYSNHSANKAHARGANEVGQLARRAPAINCLCAVSRSVFIHCLAAGALTTSTMSSTGKPANWARRSSEMRRALAVGGVSIICAKLPTSWPKPALISLSKTVHIRATSARPATDSR